VDLKKVKLHIYQDLDNITWIGVKYIGNLAEVTIVEGIQTPKPVDKSRPCHIVADKEGYIDRTIAREGVVAAQPGTFVKPGDVLISGIVPLKSTAYGTPTVNITERYVHSTGEVYAKVPYRLFYYQEKYKYLKEPTGDRTYGIRLEIGDLKINTAKIFYTYDNSVYSEKNLLHTIRPIPITLGIVEINEVDVTREERSQEEITKEANRLVRQAIKEKVPENSQILNNSLKFSTGENIIGVAVMLETLEKIGREKEIVIGNPTDRRTEDQNRP
jgi:similar to stage IV sporulation protein